MSGNKTLAPVGLIAGGGTLPFAVAEQLQARGMDPVLFALRGFCDRGCVMAFRHHWVSLGQFGKLSRLLRAEKCRDLVFIGSLIRPALSELRLDWGMLKLLPAVVAALRGGDDHALSGVARIFENHGFRVLGISDVAPELLVPHGNLTQTAPDESANADIAMGQDVLRALGPFDIGQAVVVIDRHVIGVEGIEGTDALLARVAQLRLDGRIRKKAGRGVLVKAPKAGQDLRFDLPAVGPRTIEGIVGAELGGLAVSQGRAIAAEPQTMIEIADRARVFVVGTAS